MFADDEKKVSTALDEERDYYDGYFDEIEKAEAKKTEEYKPTKKVIIEDPEEPKKDPTLKNLTIVSALISIALVVIAKLFLVVSVYVCYAIFFWLGAIVLLGSISCYVAQIIKDKAVKFEPQFVLVLLAVFSALI